MKKNSSTRLPVASMSKLITAIAATDTMSSTTLVTITPEASKVYGDASKLQEGEKFTLNEILFPMLLNSSNVAAEAISSVLNRAEFLKLMSGYAWEVGMPVTYFADPSGLDPNNASSAHDFFALARYLYKYRPDLLAITRMPKTSVSTTTEHGAHVFTNIHPFVDNPNFIGGKTGRTPEARDTMLTIMKINNQPIAIVVLASADRRLDTLMLLRQMESTLVQR